jgi:hypothetical protein
MQCTRVPRRRVASLVFAIVIAAAMPADADVVVGRDARTAVALTIYSGQDLAIVRESRSMDLPEGDSTVRFEDVAARLDPRTVTLRATDDPQSLTVLEQSYLNDLSQTLAFDVPVPAGGETVLRYRVRVGG